MKNNLLKIFVLMFSVVAITMNVNADEPMATVATEDSNNYDALKSAFERASSNSTKTTVGDQKDILVYGRGVCNGTSCTVVYQGEYSNVEDVLKRSVVCSDGSTSISYRLSTSGKEDMYDSTNSGPLGSPYTGDVYWSEIYEVSCTSSYGSDSNITLESNPTNNDDVPNNSGNDTSDDDRYDSSTTVDNEQTGVGTYFGVLGIVALISYVVMLLIKKFNLFKSI